MCWIGEKKRKEKKTSPSCFDPVQHKSQQTSETVDKLSGFALHKKITLSRRNSFFKHTWEIAVIKHTPGAVSWFSLTPERHNGGNSLLHRAALHLQAEIREVTQGRCFFVCCSDWWTCENISYDISSRWGSLYFNCVIPETNRGGF